MFSPLESTMCSYIKNNKNNFKCNNKNFQEITSAVLGMNPWKTFIYHKNVSAILYKAHILVLHVFYLIFHTYFSITYILILLCED